MKGIPNKDYKDNDNYKHYEDDNDLMKIITNMKGISKKGNKDNDNYKSIKQR